MAGNNILQNLLDLVSKTPDASSANNNLGSATVSALNNAGYPAHTYQAQNEDPEYQKNIAYFLKNSNDNSQQQTPQDGYKMLQDIIKSNPITDETQKAIRAHIKDAVPHALANGASYSDIMSSSFKMAGIPNLLPTVTPQQSAQTTVQQLLPPTSGIDKTQVVPATTTNVPVDVETMKQQVQKNILANLLNQSSPKNALGRFAQGFNNAVGNTAIDNESMKTMAGLIGMTPEAQYQMAGAADLNQAAQQKSLANQGKTPMQQSDIISATTAAQQKQIESKKAELEAEKSNLQALIKTQSDTISHPAALLMGGQGLKDLHKSIQDSFDNIKTLQGQMDSLSGNYADKTGASKSSSKPTMTPDQAKAILKARKVKGY